MEGLSSDGRAIFDLLRSELGLRLQEQGEQLMQYIGKLLEANNSTLDSLMSARVDGFRET